MGATKKMYEQMQEENRMFNNCTTELSPCYRCGVYTESDFMSHEGMCEHCDDDMHYKPC